eukprot:CAMPEP_0170173686 /NCGR_PEP_ID=MMETSP0040_2-20121228/6970_1 /TAXON_ID=641309 /ORGANISM="Lotharella oceanica, Strain CCMP622" /LENGTH=37 /DNA_ID= /DNA_START= /DNA_END= /DNA_ORIENTATION=
MKKYEIKAAGAGHVTPATVAPMQRRNGAVIAALRKRM